LNSCFSSLIEKGCDMSDFFYGSVLFVGLFVFFSLAVSYVVGMLGGSRKDVKSMKKTDAETASREFMTRRILEECGNEEAENTEKIDPIELKHLNFSILFLAFLDFCDYSELQELIFAEYGVPIAKEDFLWKVGDNSKGKDLGEDLGDLREVEGYRGEEEEKPILQQPTPVPVATMGVNVTTGTLRNRQDVLPKMGNGLSDFDSSLGLPESVDEGGLPETVDEGGLPELIMEPRLTELKGGLDDSSEANDGVHKSFDGLLKRGGTSSEE